MLGRLALLLLFAVQARAASVQQVLDNDLYYGRLYEFLDGQETWPTLRGSPAELRQIILEPRTQAEKMGALTGWIDALSLAQGERYWERVDDSIDLLEQIKAREPVPNVRRYLLTTLLRFVSESARDRVLEEPLDPAWLSRWRRLDALLKELRRDGDARLREHLSLEYAAADTVKPRWQEYRRIVWAVHQRCKLNHPKLASGLDEIWRLLQRAADAQSGGAEGLERGVTARRLSTSERTALVTAIKARRDLRLTYIWTSWYARAFVQGVPAGQVRSYAHSAFFDGQPPPWTITVALYAEAYGDEPYRFRVEPNRSVWPDLSPLYPRLEAASARETAARSAAPAPAAAAGPSTERPAASGPQASVPEPQRIERVSRARFALAAALAAIGNGDPQQAIYHFESVPADLMSATGYYYRGMTLLSVGRTEEALRSLQQALAQGAELEPSLRSQAAAMVERLGRHRAALARASHASDALGDFASASRALDEAEGLFKTHETAALRERIADGMRARSERRGQAAISVALASLASLGLAFAIVTLVRRRRGQPGLSAARPASWSPPSQAQLAAAAADPSACREHARQYVARRRAADFLAVCAGKDESFLRAYASAFLVAGDYETAHETLRRASLQQPAARQLAEQLRRVLSLRRAGSLFAAQQAYSERLSLANAFMAMSLHDEALGVLTEEAIAAAAREPTDALVVADHFQKAGQAHALVERAALKERPSEFWSQYAAALHARGAHEAALALLGRSPALSSADYELFVAAHRALGSLATVEPVALPARERVALVEGLLEDLQNERAYAAVESIPRETWGAREFRAALRALRRLGRLSEAVALKPGLDRAAPVERSPELHWYFGLLCEKAGEFEKAKRAYRDLLLRHGSFQDAAARLKRLEELPAEETSRVTTIVALATRATQSNVDVAAFVAGLEQTERAGLIGDRFVIVDHLGVGGMGIVYKARDLRLQRDVALKRLRGELLRDAGAKARFLEEAKTLSSLSHPNIVSIHDTIEFNGATYLVCEFVDGETLHELVAARGRLAARDCLELAGQICAGLEHAHARGVVHRDLKPSNIMVARGAVKLMDFGIAAQALPLDAAAQATSEMGTPAYMPPEQHRGLASYQSDIFALGVTLYEMLTGRVPFPSGDLPALKTREAYAPLPAGVPKELAHLVVRCLRADPAARPADARAVAEAIKSAFASISHPGVINT